MPEKQPPSGVELRVIKLTNTVEAIDVKVEALDQRLDRLAQTVETLTEQVGRFTEGLTKLENIVSNGFEDLRLTTRQQATQIDRQNEAINGHLRVAEAQSSNIAALTRLVEMLTQRN